MVVAGISRGLSRDVAKLGGKTPLRVRGRQGISVRSFAVRCLCSIPGMGLSRNAGLGKGRPGCEDGAALGLLSHLCSDNIQPGGALEARCSDIKERGFFGCFFQAVGS